MNLNNSIISRARSSKRGEKPQQYNGFPTNWALQTQTAQVFLCPPRRNYMTLAEITVISSSNYGVGLSSAEGHARTATASSGVSGQTRVLWGSFRPDSAQVLPPDG